jgi:WD40 repeat protein
MAHMNAKFVVALIAALLASGAWSVGGYGRFTVKQQVASACNMQLPTLQGTPSTAKKNDVNVVTDQHGDPLPQGAVVRLGAARFRHEGAVGGRSLVFAPDGKTLAASTDSGLVLLWDAVTGKELRRFTGYHCAAMDFSPDSKAMALFDTEIALLDVATGKQIFKVSLQDELLIGAQEVRFSPDGKMLAVCYLRASDDELVVLVLDAATGKENLRLKSVDSAGSMAFSPDGRTLAVPGMGQSINIYAVPSGKLLRNIGLDREPGFHAMKFSPDGRSLAWGSNAGVTLVEVASGKVRATFEVESTLLNSIAFTPDGKTLLANPSESRNVQLWDLQSGKNRFEIRGTSLFFSWAMALSKDGKTVAVESTAGRAIRLFDVANGQEKFVLEGHGAPILSVAFTPDGKKIATAGANEPVHLWDAATGKHMARLKDSKAMAVAFSPDGKQLAGVQTRGGPSSCTFWDPLTGKEILKLPGGHDELFECLAFSPDGQRLVTGNFNPYAEPPPEGTSVKVWDARTGKYLKGIAMDVLRPGSLAVAPDGKTVAVGGASQQNPDPERAFLRLVNIETGKKAMVLRGHEGFVTSVKFSPDGKLLASGSFDTTVRLWEATTGKEIRKLTGHDHSVEAVALSPDGRVVASADGVPGAMARFFKKTLIFDEIGQNKPYRIRFWDVATGKEIHCLEGHGGNVSSLAFSPDGTRLVSGLHDGTALVWDVAHLPPKSK